MSASWTNPELSRQISEKAILSMAVSFLMLIGLAWMVACIFVAHEYIFAGMKTPRPTFSTSSLNDRGLRIVYWLRPYSVRLNGNRMSACPRVENVG